MVKAGRAVVAIACAVLALTACSSEIKGLDKESETDVSTLATESPVLSTTSDPSRDESEPPPIPVSLGDCLEVDWSGVSIRFAAVVDCTQAHDAQAYQAVVVEDDTLVTIGEECNTALVADIPELEDGRTYALQSPMGFIYNQGLAVAGDEVLCVYVHPEPVTGALER